MSSWAFRLAPKDGIMLIHHLNEAETSSCKNELFLLSLLLCFRLSWFFYLVILIEWCFSFSLFFWGGGSVSSIKMNLITFLFSPLRTVMNFHNLKHFQYFRMWNVNLAFWDYLLNQSYACDTISGKMFSNYHAWISCSLFNSSFYF